MILLLLVPLSLSHCSSVDKGLARPTVGSAVPARMVSNKISAQQLHKHAAMLHWTEILWSHLCGSSLRRRVDWELERKSAQWRILDEFFLVRCDSIFIFFLSEISVCEFFFSFLAEISFGELWFQPFCSPVPNLWIEISHRDLSLSFERLQLFLN